MNPSSTASDTISLAKPTHMQRFKLRAKVIWATSLRLKDL